MPKPNLPLLVFLFCVMAFLAWRNEQAAFLLGGRVAVSLEDDGRTAVLRWSSSIRAPMARRLEEAFLSVRDQADRIVLDLHSPGGALSEGYRVVETVEWMKETHIVDTRVRGRRQCLSMCVPIYLRGEERIAAPSARFMFHEPSAYDVFTGERAEVPDFERRRTSQRFVERYFVDSEMDPAWLATLEREWEGRDVWRSARQLVAEQSNVVTRLE